MKQVSIEQVNGGYVVYLGGEVYIANNLNKAIKLVKDYLGDDSESD
jgi:hypothetical protein